MEAVLEELRRLELSEQPSPERLEEIALMANMMKEMKNNG